MSAEIPDGALFPVALVVRNIMGVKAVALSFDPKGGVYLLGGDNHQGKTSTLTGLRMCIEGAAAAPDKVLRTGTSRGTSHLTLADREGAPVLDVEVTVTPKGMRLELRDVEGNPLRRPQEKLDALLSTIGFDPLEFADLAKKDARKAGEALRKLVGLEVHDLDERAAKATEERKLANREVVSLTKQIEGLPPLHKDAGDAELSMANLLAELSEAQEEQRRREGLEWSVADAERAHQGAITSAAVADGEVKRIEAELAEALGIQRRARELAEQAGNALEQAKRAAAEAQKAPAPDLTAINAKIEGAEDANRRVRENAHRRKLEADLQAKKTEWSAAQDELDRVDEERRKRVRSAKYPIAGLAFDESASTVLLDGIPLEQVSDEERVRVSLAVGMALNPKLRALVIGRSGNDLDKNAIAKLHELALENRFLILAERVGDGDEVSVVIEDGEVREDRTQ